MVVVVFVLVSFLNVFRYQASLVFKIVRPYTMCDFSQLWSHLCGTMHCLPPRLKSTFFERLKSMFFEIFSNGVAPKGPAE